MFQTPEEPQKSLLSEEAKKMRDLIINQHREYALTHEGPTPTNTYADLVNAFDDWWNKTGSKERYVDTGSPVYNDDTSLVITEVKQTKTTPASLTISVPDPNDTAPEGSFVERFTYDSNGRLRSREIGVNYDKYEFEYSPQGFLTRMLESYYNRVRSVTEITWQYGKVSQMQTQLFSGNGSVEEIEKDGEAIISEF